MVLDMLEGTIKTPFGAVEKKTAIYALGGIIALGGIVWFRTRGSQQTTSSTDINPATGYAYGSAEDIDALAAQANYPVSASIGGGGGASGYPTSTSGGFVNNGEWSQAVVEYMTSAGLIEDAAPLSNALGRYINGSPLSSVDRSLIEQAIAYKGYPPIAGPNGFPPAFKEEPSVPVRHRRTTTPHTPIPRKKLERK